MFKTTIVILKTLKFGIYISMFIAIGMLCIIPISDFIKILLGIFVLSVLLCVPLCYNDRRVDNTKSRMELLLPVQYWFLFIFIGLTNGFILAYFDIKELNEMTILSSGNYGFMWYHMLPGISLLFTIWIVCLFTETRMTNFAIKLLKQCGARKSLR